MQNRADWIEEFRSRPIAYIVESYRLSQFPDEIRDFWAKHYIWYARSLYIAGYDIAEPREVDIIVPGRYRWDADPTSPAASLQLGNALLRPDEEIELAEGSLPAQAIGGDARGQLILADLPRPKRDGYPFFYLRRQTLSAGWTLLDRKPASVEQNQVDSSLYGGRPSRPPNTGRAHGRSTGPGKRSAGR